MQEIINPNAYLPIRWNGQIVITTALLAKVYGTEPNNVKNNFNRHKDNFIEGKHYYLLQGDDLRRFKCEVTDNDLVKSNVNQLYLWTERGANRHCKILDTDKAWEQFDNLEETYFNSKKNIINRSQLSESTQVLFGLIESVARQELEQKRLAQEVEEVKQNQVAIANTFQKTSDDEDFKAWANRCISRIAESPKFDKGVGPNSNYAFARNESYERLKKKWKCNLDDRVSRAKGRALQRNPGISKTELDSINKLTIISADKSLRPVYETVIKEMMIAYCVDADRKSR